MSARAAAWVLVFEAACCAWVLNAHLPGLIVAPLPPPGWQQIMTVVVIGLGVAPLAIRLVDRSAYVGMARLFGGLGVLVGAILWVSLVGVQAREIPPPWYARLPLVVGLFLPLLLTPVCMRKRGAYHRKSFLYAWWLAVGSYGLCELTAGELVRSRAWRILIIDSEFYGRAVADARRFVVTPGARWRHHYSDDPDGYFGAGRRIDYVANSRGLRERELPLVKPPGVFRILALGDSFTLGEGVRDGDTWPAQLERCLQDGSMAVEVINAGVNAYGTRQELEQYRRNTRDYQPDLVIVAMVWNDTQTGRPQDFGATFAGSSAALAQYLALSDRLARGVANLLGRSGVPDAPRDWEDALGALSELAEAVRADGAELLAAIYPSVQPLDNPSLRRVYAIQERFCAGADIDVWNAWPRFTAEPARRWHVHGADHHPNAAAHRLFAEGLAERIRPGLRRR